MPSSPDQIENELDLTKDGLILTQTVEELKAKLGGGEIVSRTPSIEKDDPDSPLSEMIPETQGVGVQAAKHLGFHHTHPHNNHTHQPLMNEEGLIVPRKPQNPCLEDKDRQNLHRELMFNKKIGKNVLNQKSELQRALEKHKDNQAKKELEKELTQSVPELEKVIADRAKRLQEPHPQDDEEIKGLNKQFLEARAKLRTRTDSK